MNAVNRQFRLAARPVGLPQASDWERTEEPVTQPGEGEVLVRSRYLSLDPAIRGFMNDAPSYMPPVQIGQVMRASAAGQVVASNDPAFSAGEHVIGILGVQDYATVRGQVLRKVDVSQAQLPVHLNTLGMPGWSAYFGLLEVGRFREGDTVVVSGAAGAVGGLVGQIAKLKGGRVVGIAGGPEKCRHLIEQLGFEAAIDYKSEDVAVAMEQHCPDGIDVYFDNVGGEVLDAALANLARGARVVICGAISQYNVTGERRGPANYMSLLINRASMTGFLVFDYADRHPHATRELAGWLAEGRLKSFEDYARGFDSFPEALLRLFRGQNLGKLVLEVDAT